MLYQEASQKTETCKKTRLLRIKNITDKIVIDVMTNDYLIKILCVSCSKQCVLMTLNVKTLKK